MTNELQSPHHGRKKGIEHMGESGGVQFGDGTSTHWGNGGAASITYDGEGARGGRESRKQSAVQSSITFG